MLGITKAAFAATDITGLQCQNYLGRDVCKVPFTLYVCPFRIGFSETPESPSGVLPWKRKDSALSLAESHS